MVRPLGSEAARKALAKPATLSEDTIIFLSDNSPACSLGGAADAGNDGCSMRDIVEVDWPMENVNEDTRAAHGHSFTSSRVQQPLYIRTKANRKMIEVIPADSSPLSPSKPRSQYAMKGGGRTRVISEFESHSDKRK